MLNSNLGYNHTHYVTHHDSTVEIGMQLEEQVWARSVLSAASPSTEQTQDIMTYIYFMCQWIELVIYLPTQDIMTYIYFMCQWIELVIYLPTQDIMTYIYFMCQWIERGVHLPTNTRHNNLYILHVLVDRAWWSSTYQHKT